MSVVQGKPVIYLAGGMEKAGEYGKVWRADITPHLESLGYAIWNPYLEESNVGTNVHHLAEMKQKDFSVYKELCGRIVDYDLSWLKRCAMVAVRIDQSVLEGAGTYGELTFCRYWNIPVFAWVDLPKGIYSVPGWAVGCLTEYKETKEGFYASIPKA